MLVLRTMVTAFIFNKENVLFMKRALDRRFMPGRWAPVGGHIESEEINNPMKSCLREINEETGLEISDLSDIRLKYIVHRRRENEIRIQYVYFGESHKTEVTHNEEGELFWLRIDDVLNLELSPTIRFLLSHYLESGQDTQDVLIGTVSNCDGKPAINWGVLQDWE